MAFTLGRDSRWIRGEPRLLQELGCFLGRIVAVGVLGEGPQQLECLVVSLRREMESADRQIEVGAPSELPGVLEGCECL